MNLPAWSLKTMMGACLMTVLAAAPATPLATPPADARGEDQTYLTFPEWFLVFSPDDYAQALAAHGRPSRFPFFGHVGQFWNSYAKMTGITRRRHYAFNGEYHAMVAVIGVSTTVEYGLRGLYEGTVGRVSELLAFGHATAEDALAAQQAQAYVDFIRVRPWYEFDYLGALRTLWTRTPWTGRGMVRKWERRWALTGEWLAKAGYAALLKKATRSTFQAPLPTTVVRVDALPHALPAGVRLLHADPAGPALLSAPRYQGFTDAAQALARQGIGFQEIAGNRGPIVVSLIQPLDTPLPAPARLLFRQPLATQAGKERRVVEVDVPALGTLLGAVDSGQVEHVFDY